MILILSQERELSTDKVIEWLDFQKVRYLRVNRLDDVILKRMELSRDQSDCELQVNDRQITLKDVSCFWYRRGYLNVAYSAEELQSESDLSAKLNRFLDDEHRKVLENLYFFLKDINHFGSFLDNDLNKLQNLKMAVAEGLRIPTTIITSSKEELKNFCAKHDAVITKPIFETRIIDSDHKRYYGYTNEINTEILEALPETFTVSLFQEKIEKRFEIRSFYLDGKFFSTAIFSQLDQQTQVDFRVYNDAKPNRVVPYQLPTKLEENLRAFMQKCDYRTGSIDLIATENDFVFLEVNPIGQFQQVSLPGNYQLHREIATQLCKANRSKLSETVRTAPVTI